MDNEPVSAGSAFGRVLGVFSIVGFGIGLGTIIGLWSLGFFGSQGSDDFGTALIGIFILLGAYVFSILIGLVVASVGSHYVSQVIGKRETSALVGAGAGAIGHLLMIVALTATLAAGFAVFAEDTDASGQDGATEGDASDDGVPDWEVLGKMSLAFLPAGMVGGGTAFLLAPVPPTRAEGPPPTFEPAQPGRPPK